MAEPRSDWMILIVVGASLRAEQADRPLAYRLRERAESWMDERYGARARTGDPAEFAPHPCPIVVCSDVWYLNDADLRAFPTISVGGPGVNALGAYLADKLPSLLVVDDTLMVQMDPSLEELTASVWGMTHLSTVTAIDAFCDRYLNEFLEAATQGI